MEKKNPEKFDLENETKKIQEGYISEMKAEKGIVDVVDAIATDIDIEAITDEKNDLELERLKEQKRIKAGDRINYFMIDFYYKDQPRKHCEKSMYFKLFFIKTLLLE